MTHTVLHCKHPFGLLKNWAGIKLFGTRFLYQIPKKLKITKRKLYIKTEIYILIQSSFYLLLENSQEKIPIWHTCSHLEVFMFFSQNKLQKSRIVNTMTLFVKKRHRKLSQLGYGSENSIPNLELWAEIKSHLKTLCFEWCAITAVWWPLPTGQLSQVKKNLVNNSNLWG